MKSISERASAYLAKMPVSVSGQGGHAAAFAAALVLVKGFDLGEEEALPLLAEWNAVCLPPWTESELRHKLRDAAASSKPAGYLLGESEVPARERIEPDFESEAEKKERWRKAWPEFRTLTQEELAIIAKLRGIPPDGLSLARYRGFIKGAQFDGRDCFVIHEGNFAQARRFDGGLLDTKDGPAKTKNLPGSTGAFIGQRLLGDAKRVLLVEGAFGLVEALTAFAFVNMAECWSILAATSAYSRFARDPALLALLAGRHVRIVPDMEESGTGENAAASWLADLETVGAIVDARALPDGCKDLGEVIAAPETHRETLNALFQ